MLEKINLSKKMDKREFKETMNVLTARLGMLQRECRELGIPVIVVFEGFGAAGKGTLINRLIQPLDPRGFKVYSIGPESKEEKMHPFLWRFWTKTPADGRIAIFDRSWYRRVLLERFEGLTAEGQIGYAYQEIVSFEKMLSDSGTVIIKLFLDITQEEQKKRFHKLLANEETAWRVSKKDLRRNKHFEEYKVMNEEMLQKTDTDFAPWTVVEAMDKEYAAAKVLCTVVSRLEKQIEEARASAKTPESANRRHTAGTLFQASVLDSVDLSLSYTREEYKMHLKKLQKKLSLLHSELYRRRIPVVLGFEGWDAGGKGGAIKRLTKCLDPRGYAVNPTAAPNDIEKTHHYLWRFWQNMPKAGHIAIFDRTWYGRVMVERIEGFCTCDEDWRNREKWDAYEEAVDEMLIRTSTTYAPWVIVEGNDKYYARIKVLKTVVDAIEERLKQT